MRKIEMESAVMLNMKNPDNSDKPEMTIKTCV